MAPPSYGGGSYTDCADTTQPGVAPIVNYLQSLPQPDRSALRSRPLLSPEQLQPRIFRQRQQRLHRYQRRITPCSPFLPRRCPASATSCWRPKSRGSITATSGTTTCRIRISSITGRSAQRPTSTATSAIPSSTTPPSWPTPPSATAHIQDTANLYSDIANGTLPAVSFVKPSGLVDGHPASSKLDLFEGFTQEDRGCGAGQPVAVEGHGHLHHLRRRRRLLRLRLRAASRLLRRRHAHSAASWSLRTRRGATSSHEYSDHVSILKFIERNWRLSAGVQPQPRQLSRTRSTASTTRTCRVNSPAIGDLFDMFNFPDQR